MAINFGVSIAEMELEMHRAKKLILLLMFLSFVVGCTYSPTLSGTDIPLKMAQQHCVDLTSELPTDFLSGGTVLLGDFSQLAGIGQIMTLTSEANQPKYLANVPTFSGGATSPNGKLFAYETVIENDFSKLVVLDVNRDVVFTLPWNKEWGTFNWINNQQIEFPYFWDGYWQNASPISDIIDVVTSSA